MKNDDDLVFLNQVDEYDLSDTCPIEDEHSEFNAELETTIQVIHNSKPYWQRMFG